MSDALSRIRDKFLDFGEVHYMVDSDFRTDVQGWSRADRTGPLDLYLGRQAGQYVYRTGDYGNDSLCAQAAIDATIDFRGDVILATPGSYSWGAIVTVDVPNLRLLGPTRGHRNTTAVTITDTVGSHVIAAAADRVEIGWIKFVPKTAVPFWAPVSGCDNLYVHDFVYDQRTVTASVVNQFVVASGTYKNHRFERFTGYTDGAQSPILAYTVAHNLEIFDFLLWHGHLTTGATLAVALLFVTGASLGVTIEKGRGMLVGLASNAVTNLVSAFESGGDVECYSVRDFRGNIGFCASSGLVNLAASAEAAEVGLAAAYLDVVSAGAGGAGTAYTA